MRVAGNLLSRDERAKFEDARERFVTSTASDLSHLRPVVARSWYRSRAAGVDAAMAKPVLQEGRVDGPTAQAAEAHLRRLDEVASDIGGYVSLASPSGVLVNPGYLRNEEGFPVGYSLLEENCGSTGEGVALEEGRGVWLAPEEHFRDDMRKNWCFASLVRDPFHHRVRAVVALTFPADKVSGIEPASTLLMLEGVASRIESEIEAKTSARERALMNEYLMVSRRRGNCAVIAMDGRNSLMNAAATGSLLDGDISLIASYAKEVMVSKRSEKFAVNLSGPGTVVLEISPVQLSSADTGAVVVVVPNRARARGIALPKSAAGAPMLPSRAVDEITARFDVVSLESQRTVEAARRAIEQQWSVAVIGEAGVGKRRLAETVVAGRSDLPAFDCQAQETETARFSELLRRAVAAEQPVILLENADFLDRARATELIEARRMQPSLLVAMTFIRPTEVTLMLSQAFDVFEIPVSPLRSRREDIATLANAFAREMGDRRLSRRLLSALTDSEWPGNIDQLHAVVTNAIERAQGSEVTVDDLPQGFHRALTNGRLSRLEDAELSELRNALKEAEGNRRLAAEMLQIGRSTLYRRMDYFRSRGFEL